MVKGMRFEFKDSSGRRREKGGKESWENRMQQVKVQLRRNQLFS